jgi:outer membrane protein OmpA-like peptidoglycan-associated protein
LSKVNIELILLNPKLLNSLHMQILKLYLIILVLMAGINGQAQQTAPNSTPSAKKTANKKTSKTGSKSKIGGNIADIINKLSVSAGLGTSNYMGDLTKYNVLYRQTSYSFSAGVVYEILPQFNSRIDFGYQRLQGSDAKKGGAHRSRNLDFKSNNFDLSAALEFEFFNMRRHKLSPYITGGIGMLFFNPYAVVGGKLRFLRDLGTEGQGLGGGYKAKYLKGTYEFPAGVGVKYAATKRWMIQLEFNYRFTGTDFLDDVSKAGYAPKALLDSRNSLSAVFAYRGNEVGGGPYPTGAGLNLPRGNPDNKDTYYTTQLKVVYAIKARSGGAAADVTLPITGPQNDRDGDGVMDLFDRCPDDAGLKYLQGCPDKDADGVADIDDKCADVAGFTRYQGCPIPDTDGDGVDDEQDKCPSVAGSTRYQGCAVPDTDGDGVNDDEDKCATEKGSTANFGCPAISDEIKDRIKLAAKNIFFRTGLAELLPASFTSLNDVVKILNENPTYKIQINGHTDNAGDVLMNQSLSEARAAAVRNYIKGKGIDESRLFSTGYGEINPIADNNTESGRTQNRRVEMIVRNY